MSSLFFKKGRAFSFQYIAEDKFYDRSTGTPYFLLLLQENTHFLLLLQENTIFLLLCGEYSFFVVVAGEHSFFDVVAGEHSFFVVVVAGEHSFLLLLQEVFVVVAGEHSFFVVAVAGEHITAVPTAAAAGQPGPCAAQHGGSHPHHRAHQQVRGPTRNYLPQGSSPLRPEQCF